jgi:hypothetical protein
MRSNYAWFSAARLPGRSQRVSVSEKFAMPTKPVRPRAIADILGTPVAGRNEILAKGLALLVEHVQSLRLSAEVLEKTDDCRGRPILQAVMGEEAAKVLILLDVVRGGWRDQKAATKHLGYFGDHFVRGIYQRVTSINPGSFGEVHRYIESLRPELYLDGPTGGDWIFRNEIDSARELAFYVDYVKEEEGLRWVTPDGGFRPSVDIPANATADLVLAMGRIGLLTTEALAVVAHQWMNVLIVDSTGFGEHFRIVSNVQKQLVDRRLYGPTASAADFKLVADKWPFPLNSLQLKRIEVIGTELDAQRVQAENAFWASELGPIEH